jgi:hypothetical protein
MIVTPLDLAKSFAPPDHDVILVAFLHSFTLMRLRKESLHINHAVYLINYSF